VEIGAEVGSAGCHGVLQHAGRIRELQEVVQQDLQALSGLPPHVIGDGILCIVRLHHQSSLLSALRAFDHLTDAGLTPYTLVDLIKDKGSQKTLGKSSTNR